MTKKEYIEKLFSKNLPSREEVEHQLTSRDLPEGAYCTRFAPSPTGPLHIGGVYTAIVSQNLARHSGGQYLIRIEDTDRQREVKGAVEDFHRAFDYFGIAADYVQPDLWGPYRQSERKSLYLTYAKWLVERDYAYPCFCSQDDLKEQVELQKSLGVATGYYGEWARCRSLSSSAVFDRLRSGAEFTVRFRSPDLDSSRVQLTDLIRGQIELEDNRNDFVILKSGSMDDRFPTYHFAHIVDDHLMGVSLVIRGEEWIPTTPFHFQILRALDLKYPSYAHVAPLMKIEGSSRRKLSKRSDPEADVSFYMREGYPRQAVRHYLLGLANSDLAELSPNATRDSAIRIEKLGTAGPAFDIAKLNSVSREYIASLDAKVRLRELRSWSEAFSPRIEAILDADGDRLLAAFQVESSDEQRPRKDLARWIDLLKYYGPFCLSYFEYIKEISETDLSEIDSQHVRDVAAHFVENYVHHEDPGEWFDQIRLMAPVFGYAQNRSEFKKNQHVFRGSIKDLSLIVRVLLTGAAVSPDMHTVAMIVGKSEVLRRVGSVLEEVITGA